MAGRETHACPFSRLRKVLEQVPFGRIAMRRERKAVELLMAAMPALGNWPDGNGLRATFLTRALMNLPLHLVRN